MSQGFGHTKRRVAEAKRQKREQKRLKRRSKGVVQPEPAVIDAGADTGLSTEISPAETPRTESSSQ